MHCASGLKCGCLGLLLVLGCGSRDPLGTVAGTVSLDGKPMPNAMVRFQPISSGEASGGKVKGAPAPSRMGSFGWTDSNGKFTLKMSDTSRTGAIIGEHSVTIMEGTPGAKVVDENTSVNPLAAVKNPKAKPTETPAPKIPKKWTDGTARFTVKAGTNTADFEVDK